MIQAWKPFNVEAFADKLDCPALFITGEAEYAEQSTGPLILSVGKFLKNLKIAAWFHEFSYADGWAASHCQIGAQRALEELVYDWLDKVLNKNNSILNDKAKLHSFDRIISYFSKIPEVKTVLTEAKIMAY